MKLSSYLSISRHGVYYFRWTVPSHNFKNRISIKISLRTKCPDHASDLARYLASSRHCFRDNKDLARLRQDQIRETVSAYFQAQLAQYLEWHNNRGFTENALEDMRCEEFDHALSVEQGNSYPRYLPVARFKRKMAISDADWDDSEPRITFEVHRGRRDMLRQALRVAESFGEYSYTMPDARRNAVSALVAYLSESQVCH